MNTIIKITILSLVAFSTINATSTSIIETKKETSKYLNKEFTFSNQIKTQLAGSGDLQITDYINGEVILDEFVGIFSGFKIKTGFNSIIKLKGPTMNNYRDGQETKQDSVQAYGSLQFDFLDKKIAGAIGVLKLHTPLLNSKVSYSIFDTYYGGGLAYSKYSIDDYSFQTYGGYLLYENRELTKLEELDSGFTTFGFNGADQYGNKIFSQFLLQDTTYEVYIESINVINDSLKINSSVLYVDSSEKDTLNLESNYLLGLESSYLINKYNFLSTGYTYKNNVGDGLNFLNTQVKNYTNGLHFNPLTNDSPHAFKIKYISKYNEDIKNTFYTLKYFSNFGDKMFDYNDFEIGYINTTNLDRHLAHSSIKIQAAYINLYDNVSSINQLDKLLRMDFIYKF